MATLPPGLADGTAHRAWRCRSGLLLGLIVAGLVLLTAPTLGARSPSDAPAAAPAAQGPGEGQSASEDPAAPPAIAGVAEMRRTDASGVVVDAFAYPLPGAQNAFDWPVGSGRGDTGSGVALLAWPRLAKDLPPGSSTALAVANLVGKPGFTDFAIMLYDQNGLMDYVCQKLNEKQVDYIALDTWGYVNGPWIGSAILSAVFWEHDVFNSEDGAFVRNLVGLAGVAFDSRTDRAGASGDFGSGSVAAALMPALGAAYGPDLSWGVPCPPRDHWRPWSTATPSATPVAATATPTATWTPTPSPTATPLAPPPYAPGSPEVSLPALAQLRSEGACSATLRVQNGGREATKALAVFWDAASQCGSGCVGPSDVLCSGLVKPGSTWEFSSPSVRAAARSATVFSFAAKRDFGSADYLCDEVPERVIGSCEGYATFQQAYDTGGAYLDVPMDRAWGAPLVVQVYRSCEEPPGIDLGVRASYQGASGTDLGFAAPGGTYAYSLPRIVAQGDYRSSVVHVQNVGDACATVELATHLTGAASSRCEPPVPCAIPPVAPGESVSIDMADCRPPGFEGSGVVHSNMPLAVVVDDSQPRTLTSYGARPTSPREMHGEPLLSASGAVSFAPLLLKNHQGWTSRLHVQNLGPGQTFLKVTMLDRSGDAVSTAWFGPLCEFDAATIDVETMAGVPYQWLGTARVESYPALPPDATPWAPAPTSTAPATTGPSPTATPCSGTCPPTSTATPRLPTVTPAVGPSATPRPGPTSTVQVATPTDPRFGRLHLPLCGRAGDWLPGAE